MPTTRRNFLTTTVASLAATGSVISFAKPKRQPIKVGQIGVEHAHATKLEVYRESPDYEVVSIVEPDERLRKQASEKAAFRGVP